MRKFLPVILIASLGLAGCGYVRDSRLNPFNWFGNAESRPVSRSEAEAERTNPLIPRRSALAAPEEVDMRTRIPTLESLVIERMPGGAILRVTGISALLGAHDVELRPVSEDEPVDGVAHYELVAYQPAAAAPGPVRTRRVTAALRMSEKVLAETRQVEVYGAENVLTSRR